MLKLDHTYNSNNYGKYLESDVMCHVVEVAQHTLLIQLDMGTSRF